MRNCLIFNRPSDRFVLSRDINYLPLNFNQKPTFTYNLLQKGTTLHYVNDFTDN